MKNLAIIPARGGSKRIPRKNIKDFCGRPIISHSIEAAKDSELFDRIIVSTNDNEIAEIAREFGAEVPFLRSEENSGDYASTVDVLLEVVERVKDVENICCLYPTAPFISVSKLVTSFEMFKSQNRDSLIPVTKFNYPPQRGLILKPNGLEMKWSENLETRSQDLEPLYHDVGQFYWITNKALLEQKKLFTKNCGAFEVPSLEAQDIDTPEDWKIAEFKYEYLRGNKE